MVKTLWNEVTLKEAYEDQSNVLVEVLRIKKSSKFQRKNKKKKDTYRNSFVVLMLVWVLDAFERRIFPIKNKGTGFSNFSQSKHKTPK